MHPESYEIMGRLFSDYAPKGNGQPMYDIGSCDHNGTYKPIVMKYGWTYKGVDIMPGANVDIVISTTTEDGNAMSALPPVPLVISGQCMEHVSYPWIWLAEIRRILLPGGLLFLIAPAAWNEHKYPIDCWRFLPDGMRALADFTGMRLLKAGLEPTRDQPLRDVDCWAVLGNPE